MKSLLLSFFVLIGSMTFAPKKADAGIIVIGSTGGAAVGVVMASAGGVWAGIGTIQMINSNSRYDFSGVGKFVLGGLTLVLDTDDVLASKDQFKTIPEYIFDEIEAIADERKAEAMLIKENIKEIILTDDEVDELFITLDESVDQEELSKLRLMLTTSVVAN